MKRRVDQRMRLSSMAAALVGAWSLIGAAQTASTPEQMVARLKEHLAESQARLRRYEWIETTAISLKGEEKSRKQQRVYYGADGTLTKTPLEAAAPAPQAPPAGRRGARLKQRIVETKKDEMQEYMAKAVALIHRYVPPDAARIEQAKQAGRLQIQPLQAAIVRAQLTDFVQPADALTLDIDSKSLLLSAVNVATYLDTKDEVVTLDVRFGTLSDGTGYARRTTLDAKAKNIQVVVENTGHRPLAR